MNHLNFYSIIGVIGLNMLLLTGCDQQSLKDSKTSTASNVSIASTTQVTTPSNPNLPTYTMAVEAIYAPFAFKDEKGQVVGFDADIIRAIGQKQRFNINILSQPWKGIFDTLDNGSRDIVGSGIVATPERAQKMELSNPIIEADKTAAYLASRTDINSFEDLKNKKVGVQKDTAYHETLKNYMGADNPNIIPYNGSFIAFQHMLNGKTDASFNNGNINRYYYNTLNKEYKIGSVKFLPMPNTEPDKIVFAVKKGRTDLLKKINEGLVQIKSDGTYDTIYKKWFGELPMPMNTTSVSAATIVPASSIK